MEKPFWFQVLPSHPRLKWFEALSSHIILLIEENDIETVRNFSMYVFPGNRPNVFYGYKDFPVMSSWGSLPILSACSDAELLSATFFNLGVRLKRSLNPAHLSTYLTGSISNKLRYCPYCVKETHYYSLLWRFNLLIGCPKHKCFLLDRCLYCGCDIPIMPNRPKIGFCPKCGVNLSDCVSGQLTSEDDAKTQIRYTDLAFLLSPINDGMQTITYELGRNLKYLRLQAKLEVPEIAAALNIRQENIYAIERCSEKDSGKLIYIFKYLDLLNISLKEILELNVPNFPTPYHQTVRVSNPEEHSAYKHDDDLSDQMLKVISRLRALKEPVTQIQVSKRMGLTVRTLRRYPKTRGILAQVAKEEKRIKKETAHKDREKELLADVLTAIDRIKNDSLVVTPKQIAKYVGKNLRYLRTYEKVNEVLKRNAGPTKRKSYPNRLTNEEELLDEIQRIVKELGDNRDEVTPETIGAKLHVSTHYLYQFPKVCDLLSTLASERAERIEQELCEKMLLAIDELRAESNLVTQTAIAGKLGVPLSTLKTYVRTRALLAKISDEERKYNSLRFTLERQKELLAAISKAVETIISLEKKLTLNDICKLVGVKSSTLMKYSEVFYYLQEVLGKELKKPKEFKDVYSNDF